MGRSVNYPAWVKPVRAIVLRVGDSLDGSGRVRRGGPFIISEH